MNITNILKLDKYILKQIIYYIDQYYIHEWNHILRCVNYTGQPNFIITSKDIKNCKKTWKGKDSQFEPRLLCKYDRQDKRPDIFKKHNINILSVKNGTYILTHDNIYIDIPEINKKPISIETDKSSCILSIGDSESSLLDNLRYGGIIEYIIGEKITHGSLLGGRHRATFKTLLGNTNIEIKGSQYETDGCFETENTICLIELKSIKVSSINIRQLYYPYKVIYDKIKNTKKIITLFIYKDKQKHIHIYKYEWINPEIMTNIHLIDTYKYILNKKLNIMN